MAVIDVNGDIISNDDKWFYDWFDWEGTCPDDVKKALNSKEQGEKLTVRINSGGGDVMSGQEIYSLLYGRDDVEIQINSMAGSAAGVIAMANRCVISPVAMIMIHNVSMTRASGDYREMQKNAEILQQMNSALAQAFVNKTGRSEDEILKMMDEETWLTANQAVEYGFVDGVMEEKTSFINCSQGLRLTDELRKKALAEKEAKNKEETRKQQLLEDLDMYGV